MNVLDRNYDIKKGLYIKIINKLRDLFSFCVCGVGGGFVVHKQKRSGNIFHLGSGVGREYKTNSLVGEAIMETEMEGVVIIIDSCIARCTCN